MSEPPQTKHNSPNNEDFIAFFHIPGIPLATT